MSNYINIGALNPSHSYKKPETPPLDESLDFLSAEKSVFSSKQVNYRLFRYPFFLFIHFSPLFNSKIEHFQDPDFPVSGRRKSKYIN